MSDNSSQRKKSTRSPQKRKSNRLRIKRPKNKKQQQETKQSKSRSKKSRGSSKQNSSKKTRQSLLRTKQAAVESGFSALEGLLIKVYGDLMHFKPIHPTDEISHIRGYEDKEIVPNELADALDTFGHKILELLPLVLEAKSMVHDFDEYRERVSMQYNRSDVYVGIKAYKKKRHYEEDEVGPICGVFDDSEEFENWTNDKKVRRKYGANIGKIKVSMRNQRKKAEDLPSVNEIGMEMVSEQDTHAQDEDVQADSDCAHEDDEDTVSDEEPFSSEEEKKEDVMIGTDEDVGDEDVEKQRRDSNHNRRKPLRRQNAQRQVFTANEKEQEEEDGDVAVNDRNKANVVSEEIGKKMKQKEENEHQDSEEIQDETDNENENENENEKKKFSEVIDDAKTESVNQKLPPKIQKSSNGRRGRRAQKKEGAKEAKAATETDVYLEENGEAKGDDHEEEGQQEEAGEEKSDDTNTNKNRANGIVKTTRSRRNGAVNRTQQKVPGKKRKKDEKHHDSEQGQVGVKEIERKQPSLRGSGENTSSAKGPVTVCG